MVECEDSVWLIARQLELITAKESSKDAYELLQKLKELPITCEVLKKTKVGLVVNSFRKSGADHKSVELANKLILEWKKLIPNKDETGRRLSDTVPSLHMDEKSLKGPSPTQCASASSQNTMESWTTPKWTDTDDEMRLKCREVLLESLSSGDFPKGSCDPKDLACSIESNIYKLHKAAKEKYSNCIRSRVFNLRDPKNPELRLNVLTGLISAGRLARMTSVEMASSEMKHLRDKLEKEATEEHLMGTIAKDDGSAPLVCDECGSQNCEYQTTVQPRSSEEPMSYSVTCNGCGNRWKVF